MNGVLQFSRDVFAHGWLGASGLAAAVSAIELFALRRGRVVRKAAQWIVLRFLLNAATGALAYWFVTLAFAGLSWFTGPVPWIIAGISGPAFVRSQFALLGSGQETIRYGPANMFVRIQDALDNKTDMLCSAAETAWLHDVALPALKKHVSLTDLTSRTCTFIWGLDNVPPLERTARTDYVKAVAADAATPEDDRYWTTLAYLLDQGGRGFLATTVKNLPP
jgi:hypothetical protein